jgi:nucleoside-diphosphate-sugar epimerase
MKILETDIVFFGFGKITNLIIKDFLKNNYAVSCITDNQIAFSHKNSKKLRIIPYSELNKIEISAHTVIFTWRDLSKIKDQNLQLSQWLGSKLFSIKKSFLLSSASVYKDSNSIQDESKRNLELNIEKNKKYILENYITNLMVNKNSKHTNLRISNVYGNDLDYGLINSIINYVTKKSKAKIFTDLEIKRDYLEVEDLIYAIQKLNKLNVDNDNLNVSTGIGTSISEIVSIFHDKKINLDYVPRIEAPVNTKINSILDCSKLKNLINWNPTQIEDGIAKLIRN